jgi:hypothetical protein
LGVIVIPILAITAQEVTTGRKSVAISLRVAFPIQANTWDAHIWLGTRLGSRRIALVRTSAPLKPGTPSVTSRWVTTVTVIWLGTRLGSRRIALVRTSAPLKPSAPSVTSRWVTTVTVLKLSKLLYKVSNDRSATKSRLHVAAISIGRGGCDSQDHRLDKK